ncbi:hypothetical protein L1049_002818 [Liquidambar formosana]|uniref:Coiled-coil domain-containing protein 86 n=1 Tax=Liquidambar formosana TaxID=63359 RepID=A0AAP0R7Q8_LIQFO
MACTIDFRYLDEGFGGKTYKRKRSAQTEDNNDVSMEIDGDGVNMDNEDACPPSKRPALPSSENPDKPTFGRPTYDGVIAGKVSGRKWKQARKQRASAANISRKGTTEEIRNNKVEKRKKREEREKRKQENILRSGTKFQKITNPKTLKKIAKSKQRKLLKVVPDDLLKK